MCLNIVIMGLAKKNDLWKMCFVSNSLGARYESTLAPLFLF
jgi:hypothetical protein